MASGLRALSNNVVGQSSRRACPHDRGQACGAATPSSRPGDRDPDDEADVFDAVCHDLRLSSDVVQMNINRVVLTGNLTANPDLRQLQSGNALCRLRLASNTRRRQANGSWGEKANYFDVVAWGPQAEAAKRYLAKGSAVAVDGRLEWREWTTESGEKRQAVEVVAENLEFLERRVANPEEQLGFDDPKEAKLGDNDVPF